MAPLPGIASLARRLLRLPRRLADLERGLDDLKVLAAQPLVREARQAPPPDRLCEREFRVFSQFGDDGIIQYLIHHVRPLEDTFVEFGVGDYAEANTRFLLVNDNWRGVVLDSGAAGIRAIRRQSLAWRHDLRAVEAFLTRENADEVLGGLHLGPAPGLLSIDIDGNDYWVWEALTAFRPTIVIVEYNALFGCRRALTVPYRADFERFAAHHSGLYHGCSLPGLARLAHARGYDFVGCNRHGNNAYFVDRERRGPVPAREVRDGFEPSRIRDSRDAAGRLTHVGGKDRLRLIADLPLLDLDTGRTVPAGEAAGDGP
jgi:hypothetical protein